MRAMRCLLAAMLAAGIVTVVAAQPGGGFGGFGGGGNVETLVFTNTALQEDLKVTDAQKEKFKPAVEKLADLNKKRGEMFKGGGFGKDGDKEKAMEKFKEFQEESTKVNEEVKKIRDEVLTDAQKKRLHQISIQVMDFTVFNDPEAKGGGKTGGGFGGFGGVSEAQKEIMKQVQETLKLTDSQKSSVKTIIADFNKERQEINKDAGIKGGGGFGGGFGGKQPDPEKVEAANKKIDKVRKEAWGKIEEALDDTQKKAWKDLVGDAFDTSKLRPVAPKKD